MAADPLRTDRTRRWPLVLGALAAAALAATALLDFGDPMARAGAEIQVGATARAEAVRATWVGLRGDSGDLVAPLGGLAAVVPDERPSFMARRDARRADGAAPLAQALARAARGARARGELERADELAREAAERARGADGRLFAEIALDRARWASQGDAAGQVRARRAELVADGAAEAVVDGTSVLLLAALVPPVDVALAVRALENSDQALPVPRDAVAVESGLPRVEWDPWWTALQGRLVAADAERDWDALFRRDARRAEAVRALFGGALGGTDDAWSLTRRSEIQFAVRRGPAGTRVLAVTEAQIAERIEAALPVADAQPYRVRFDHEPAPQGTSGAKEELVREREWLDGTSLGFTIHREDPFRAGRVEAARLTAVRGGLVVLAVAILCATLLADRATRRARRLERARSTFVASVSHDLRTPIQSILLMSETLERGRIAGGASQGRYFTTIRQEAQRLRRLIEDILDGARLDRGEGARVARETIETEAFFRSLEDGLRERAERDGARLEFLAGALPETLEIDPDGTLRIVWNLVENALRHGRADGAAADVRVEIEVADDVLAIAVHDRGPGVPARFAQSIFEPFERADAEQGGSTGTGLGLSIVRALARAHGGDAELVPTADGAHFVARLAIEPTNRPEDPAA